MFLSRAVFIYFAVSVSGYDNLDLRFLAEFAPHESFYSNIYNLIACREIESINLLKMFSRNLGRFVRVHEADNGLRQFDEEPQTFLLNIGCSEAEEILQQAQRLKLFFRPFRWLLLGKGIGLDLIQNSENTTEVEETSLWSFLETLSILPDSDLKMVERNAEGKFSVTGAYKVSNLGSLIREPLAEWTPEGGLVVFNPKVTTIRRWSLRGLALPSTLVLTHSDSVNHLEDVMDKHVDTSSKVTYNMLRLLEITNNFSTNLRIGRDWGVFRNGSWTGMMGELERNEIHFAYSPLFFLKQRLHLVDYYASVTPTKGKFMFLSPPLSYSSNIFALPFDTIVWYCCLGTLAVSCFLLYTALRIETSYSEDTIDGVKRNVSFTEVLVLNIGAICLQGTVVHTKDPPGRIITLFCYLSYMFLNISYSAAIVALLQSPDTSIRSFQDFIKSPLKGGADDVIYSQHFFKGVQEKVRREIYLKKIAPKGEPEHFYSPEEGIQKVRHGFFAYHVECSVGYQLIQKLFTEEEKCALQELDGNYFDTSDPWLVMVKKSPYLEQFKIGMARNIERGFKNRFVRRYYTEKPICKTKAARFVSVGIVDCYYPFMLLLWGIVSSVVMLITEFSLSRLNRKWNKAKLVKSPDHFDFVN